MTEEVLKDREKAHDWRGSDHTHLHSHFFPCTLMGGGVPVHWKRVEAEEQSCRAEPQQALSTCEGASISTWLWGWGQCPRGTQPRASWAFPPWAQESHIFHRPTRPHVIWLLPWWPALLTSGFTPVAIKAILPSLEHSSVFQPQSLCRVWRVISYPSESGAGVSITSSSGWPYRQRKGLHRADGGPVSSLGWTLV